MAADGRQLPPCLPAAPDEVNDLGKSFFVPAWAQPTTDGRVPEVLHATRWGAVMVLSHECELQKDFNALVRSLINDGMPPDKAVETAEAHPDLDRFANVTPLLTYEEVALEWPADLRTDARLEDVRRRARVGYLPLPAHPDGCGGRPPCHSVGRAPSSAVSYARNSA